MAGYQCGVCGRYHDAVPMDIALQRPSDYYRVPPDEREQRIKINADLCSIDDEHFFIRGYLPLPVQNSDEEFGWGVWVEVEPKSFYRYLELYEADGTNEPPFIGLLSANLKSYQPSTYQLPVDVQLRRAEDRPVISFPEHVRHPLAQEQREGITMARVHEILHLELPDLFPAT